MVGSALAGIRDERLEQCERPFRERVDWLACCRKASEHLQPILTRWKIPVRFDPQSLLVRWAVDQKVDLTSEPTLAKCLPELAETKEQAIGLTEWNEQGKTRFQLFKRWYSVSDILDASQRLTELQGIFKEAKKAELEEKLLQEVEAKLHEEAERQVSM